MIYINQVFQYVKDSIRIRVVEIEESYVFIVDIDAHTSMPKKSFMPHCLQKSNKKSY